jgi:CheY-like chemotaxis protein
LNALQYTPHGTVSIHFSDLADHLSFSVKDTGVGISTAELSHIFTEFYRIERTRGVHEGLGLGLTIVKRLCNLIGATIDVASTPGQGSTFTITTRCPVSAPLDEPRTVAWSHSSHEMNAAHSLRGKCIAIFEDDPAIEEAYRHTLSSRGAQIVVLSDLVQELTAQIENIDHIDCILSDFRLKHSTGDVLIETLRDNYNHEIPAVIVTGDTSPDQIHTFEKLNVRVLHKPVTFQKILSTIEELLKGERDVSALA